MAHSYGDIYIHSVFATKSRIPLIRPAWESRLHDYLGGIVRKSDCLPIEINGMQDHMHLLTSLARKISVAELMGRVKAGSTLWINQNRLLRMRFSWQEGYACFSVSRSQLDKVRSYIRNQKQHHRRRSFDEELRELFERNGLHLSEF